MTNPHDRNSGDADLLPKSITPLYAKAENAEIEYYSSKSSGLVCKEELEEIRQEALDAKNAYNQALKEALSIRDGIVFESVPEGHKDWNEVLLARIQKTEDVEREENVTEERRTSAFRR